MKNWVIALLALGVLSGCATRGAGYTPIIDTKDKDPVKLQQDVAECQAFAKQAADAAEGAAAGAVVGAVLAAILAPRDYRRNMVNRGALIGAAGGGAQAAETQEAIIKRCMTGRGYSVLN